MKKVIATLAVVLTSTFAFAQDTPLEISGSADAYWKYDFDIKNISGVYGIKQPVFITNKPLIKHM
jgi:hypothetical protein